MHSIFRILDVNVTYFATDFLPLLCWVTTQFIPAITPLLCVFVQQWIKEWERKREEKWKQYFDSTAVHTK